MAQANVKGRGKNAIVAAEAFARRLTERGYDKHSAWKAIAELLLTCELWEQKKWIPFKNVVVYRESNDFRDGSTVVARAEDLSAYLANELGCPRDQLCAAIGRYWHTPSLRNKQPHNLVGHGFRSMLVEALKRFGDQGIDYLEEVSPHEEFRGHPFQTRSKNAKIDIIARRGQVTVALITSKWRFRHDRMDMIDEALAYVTPAHRINPHCKLYVWLGEFAPNRLAKVLDHCPPTAQHHALSAAVHFNPKLITEGLGENGRTVHLKGLDWLIEQTFHWK